MLGHKGLFRGWNTTPSLKFFTFVSVEPIVPVDWLFAHEAKVCLPSDHSVAMLDDIGAFLTGEVFFAPQEIVSEEQIHGQPPSQVLQFLTNLLAIFVFLSLLKWVTFLASIECIKYVNNACSLVCWYS